MVNQFNEVFVIDAVFFQVWKFCLSLFHICGDLNKKMTHLDSQRMVY